MPFRIMEQGIEAVRQGNKVEGARLLKIALNNAQLQGALRATTYLWLAETRADIKEKIECHRQALESDPNNEKIRSRLARLLEMDLPSFDTPDDNLPTGASTGFTPPSGMYVPTDVPPPAVPANQPPVITNQMADGLAPKRKRKSFYRMVGIIGGPNGLGTGFFVNSDGLVATTRFVVGGATRVTIELEAGHRLQGRVVRSYPEIDLAFIETDFHVHDLLPFSLQPTIPDNTPLTAVSYSGKVMTGQRRISVSDLREEWFTTTIHHTIDAGGNPVFDENNTLVGMLTRNANRTSVYFFGLSIHAITRYVHHFQHESRDSGTRSYCPSCGYLARAGALGGFYCEMCGSVLPEKADDTRFPLAIPQLDGVYGENIHRKCPKCQARAGFFNSVCLRCGYNLNKGTHTPIIEE